MESKEEVINRLIKGKEYLKSGLLYRKRRKKEKEEPSLGD